MFLPANVPTSQFDLSSARTYLSDSYQNSTADAEAAVDDLLRFETTFRTNKAKLRLLLRRNAPDADIDACRWTTLEQVAA